MSLPMPQVPMPQGHMTFPQVQTVPNGGLPVNVPQTPVRVNQVPVMPFTNAPVPSNATQSDVPGSNPLLDALNSGNLAAPLSTGSGLSSVNWDEVKDSNFTLLEPGKKYNAKVTIAEYKQIKTGENAGQNMLSVELIVTGPSEKGAKVLENCQIVGGGNFKSKSLLSSMGLLHNGRYVGVDNDLSPLVGKITCFVAGNREWDGKTYNCVDGGFITPEELTYTDPQTCPMGGVLLSEGMKYRRVPTEVGWELLQG